MVYLQQYKNNKLYIHAVCYTVSEAIEFYYKWRKDYGCMEVTSEGTEVLATLGSK